MKSKKSIVPIFSSNLAFTLIATVLILAVGWSRHLPLENPALHNFSPVLALFFCGAVYLRGTASWLIPAVAVVGSDLLLNPTYGENLLEPFMLATYGGFALAVFVGRFVSKRRAWPTLLGGVLGCSISFYLLTNFFAWLVNPAYAKTLAGLWQALTIGTLGFPPTYLFLRNSLVSDLLFTGIFATGCEWALARQALPTQDSKGQVEVVP